MNQHAPVIGLPRPPGLGWIVNAADALSGLGELDRLYALRPPGLTPPQFMHHALDRLQISIALDAGTLADIPQSGPLLVVANHPYGGAEGFAIADLLLQRRGDVRLLANALLQRVPEVAPLVIPIDVFRSGVNGSGVRQALQHLQAGGALLVFPSGEVSRFDRSRREIADPPWLPTAAMLARRSGARVLPVHVGGRPRLRSVVAGLLHARLRTAMLARDLLALRGQTLRLSLGSVIEPRELQRIPRQAQTSYLRLVTYSLQRRNPARPAQRLLAPLAPPVPKPLLVAEIAALPPQRCLFAHGDFALYLAAAGEMPRVLEELGRLRERSFRELDEGSGQARDLDRHDADYRHLFVWHRGECAIVGAYRLGYTDAILPAQGVAGLYTHSLFDFDAQLFRRLGPAIELGRSFVVPEWQRSFHPLRLLWAGIATILQRHPEVRCLFGPVSISPSYSRAGRELIAQALKLHHSDRELRSLVRPRNPLKQEPPQEAQRNVVSALADPQLLSRLVSRLERGPGLPVLLRHYLEINGRFAGFNVDEAFGGSLDGLVFVDVARIPPRVLTRYAAVARGRAAAAADPSF